MLVSFPQSEGATVAQQQFMKETAIQPSTFRMSWHNKERLDPGQTSLPCPSLRWSPLQSTA